MAYSWDVENHKTYNNKSGHYKFNCEYNFILKNLIKTPRSILDIGGGSGRFVIPLLEHCNDITVIDINEQAIEILKTRNSKIKTICSDFMTTIITESFPFIISVEVLSYFQDKNAFFQKVKTLLDQNGVFVFSYTNPDSWRFMLRKFWHVRKKAQAYHEVNLKELKRILADNGFVIKEIEGMNWIPMPLTADNALVSVFAFFEKFFHLNKWISQSPWIMISVKLKD